jgi:hypothetical protein
MIGHALRIVAFRGRCGDYEALGTPHLLLGLLLTWAVGIGRYWDNPRVSTLQHSGLGSVAYVFVLSTFLWLLGLGLRPDNWRLSKVLTFVSLTAPPGLLYALPVEKLLSPSSARTANLWFLAIVATWRVVLYAQLLRRYARLPTGPMVVQLLLPLTLIVSALTLLNLERAVFNVMGGIEETTSADTAYFVLVLLTGASAWVFPFLFIVYVVYAVQRRRAAGQRQAPFILAVLLALVLDASLSKQEQLTLILNTAYFGESSTGPIHGFPAAARSVYATDLDQLTDTQFLGLVTMLVGPNAFHPVRSPQAHQARLRRAQNLVAGRCQPTSWRDVHLSACDLGDATPAPPTSPSTQ